ncbi:MAG: hypothetical protein U9O89_00030 [Thermoproteota archaeon]|nr:hypothetical protein [Thermoproteota archaeon]
MRFFCFSWAAYGYDGDGFIVRWNVEEFVQEFCAWWSVDEGDKLLVFGG